MTALRRTLHNIPTNELRVGDVVLNYGMRILLDRPVRVFDHGRDNGPGWSWLGSVLNPEQSVREYGVPRSFMRYPHTGESYVWSVQGNTLARWTAERITDEPLFASFASGDGGRSWRAARYDVLTGPGVHRAVNRLRAVYPSLNVYRGPAETVARDGDNVWRWADVDYSDTAHLRRWAGIR